MEYKLRPTRTRQKWSRLAATLVALCLPIVVATFFSGSFFRLGTLKPGEVFDATAAQASGHDDMAGMHHSDPNALPTNAIQISFTNNGFSPSAITIQPGSTVAWMNHSSKTQAIRVTSPVAFSSAPLNAGDIFLYVFGQSGTFSFRSSDGAYEGIINVNSPAASETGTSTPGSTGTTTPGSTTTAGATGTTTPGSTTTAGTTSTTTPGSTGTTTPGTTGTTTPGTTGTPQPGCTPSGTASVSINGGFTPSSITVDPGTSITWTNNGSNRARVRDIGHILFDSGDLDPGQSWSYTFCNSGSFPYENSRSGATGVVNITGGTPGSTTTTTPGTPGTPGTTTPGTTTTAQPSGTAQTTSTPNPGVVNVYAMRHDVFSPDDVTISTGTTVRWTNADDEDHTSTSDTGVWNSGVLHSGQWFEYTFLEPGTYHYTCLIHGVEMQGVIRVTGPAITPTPGGATSTPQPTVVVGTVDVSIQNYAFQPNNVTILVGSTIRWTNLDSAPHTATSDTGVFDSGTLNQNGTFSYTFNTPGTYAYHCNIHTGMRGTINVVTSLPTGTPQTTTTTTAQPSTTGTAQTTGTVQATGTAQSTTTAQPTGTTMPQIVDMTIQNYTFTSITITVQTGTTVRWTNLDPDIHSVTSSTGLFDSGPFGTNAHWQYTFNAPGTYQYFCTVHGTFMTGYVVVEGSPVTCQVTYPDVPVGSTFYEFVRCLSCRNVLGGYPDGTFRPGNNITRGQLAKIVSNAAGWSDTPAGQTFEDVAFGSTFYIFIERMASRGIIGGYACGDPGEPCGTGNKPYFRPNANATRGQISKIVANAAGYNDTPGGQTFEDVPANHTFYLFIERLVMHNVMNGYNCGGPGEPCGTGSKPYFRPVNNATRGQLAKIVSNSFFPNCIIP